MCIHDQNWMRLQLFEMFISMQLCDNLICFVYSITYVKCTCIHPWTGHVHYVLSIRLDVYREPGQRWVWNRTFICLTALLTLDVLTTQWPSIPVVIRWDMIVPTQHKFHWISATVVVWSPAGEAELREQRGQKYFETGSHAKHWPLTLRAVDLNGRIRIVCS